MRINILIVGGLILVVSTLYANSEIVAFIFGSALGTLNTMICILTPRPVGITIPADQQSLLKLSLDKGVIGTNIYVVVFSEKKLVLRKLSSAKVTVLTALILAILGWILAGPFGIVVGGITAFSLQEFVTQRRRDEIERGNILDASGGKDLEFPYDKIDHLQLLGNKIRLHLNGRIVRIVIPRRTSRDLGDVLEKIIPAKIQSRPVPSARAP